MAVCGYKNIMKLNRDHTLTFDRVYDEVSSGGVLEKSGYFTAEIEGVYLVTLKTEVGLHHGERLFGYLKLSSGNVGNKYGKEVFIYSRHVAGGGYINVQASASRYVKMAAGETLHILFKPDGSADVDIGSVDVFEIMLCVSLYSASG